MEKIYVMLFNLDVYIITPKKYHVIKEMYELLKASSPIN